jgi:hypothetical protein
LGVKSGKSQIEDNDSVSPANADVGRVSLASLSWAPRAVIEAPKPRARTTRYELTDHECAAIKPMLPNRLGGVRVLKGRAAVLRSRCCRCGVAVAAVAGCLEPMSPVGLLGPTSIAAFCWRITRHNTLAALADLYPQWLLRDLLPLPPSGGIPREATRSLSPPSSADAAGQGLRVGRCGAHRSPSRPRWSRA